MRNLIFAFALILSAPVNAFEIENRALFGPPDAPRVLNIISTADIAFFEPMIHSYLSTSPTIRVDYVQASSTELMRAIYEEGQVFDLAISSAMDLQTKLANDGFALTHVSDYQGDLPDWAVWNDMVYAFTQEPAALVLSRTAFEGLSTPSSRQELINALRENPEIFQGRIGTYDIRSSGLGYLFATQDARISETYWRLTEVMGSMDTQLYTSSSQMIEDVENGTLAIAYNVLGSYAANQNGRSGFEIILPADFTTVMLRTVLIPSTSESPENAARFIDHMMYQVYVAQTSPLSGPTGLSQIDENTAHRIRLGPGLLVFLDQFKKASFLSEWQSAILQD